MTPTAVDVTPASSPAPPVQGNDAPQDFRSFRESENAKAVEARTGKPASPPAASKPETNSSAEGDKPEEKAAPASEAGKESQEQTRHNANTRIRSLLAENKALQAELAKHRQPKPDVTESSPAVKPEVKAEGPKGLEAPKKPRYEDFTGDDAWQKYEDAKDQYYEELADYRAAKRLEDYRQSVAQEAQQRELLGMVDKASERYGAAAREIIGNTVAALAGEDIPAPVKAALDRSPRITDLLYVVGSNPDDLAALVDLSKQDPIAAIKRIAVMEHLIEQDGGKPAERAIPDRGEDGKFVSSKEPEKPATKAPAIGTEVSGRGAAAPDATVTAAKTGDFRSFKAAEDAAAVAKHRGRR